MPQSPLEEFKPILSLLTLPLLFLHTESTIKLLAHIFPLSHLLLD